jgi:hypothetical protein
MTGSRALQSGALDSWRQVAAAAPALTEPIKAPPAATACPPNGGQTTAEPAQLTRFVQPSEGASADQDKETAPLVRR